MDDVIKTNQQLIDELDQIRDRLHLTEKALDDSNRKLSLMEMILDHLPATVYVKDRTSRHIWINKKDLEIKGASTRDEVIGKTDQEFFETDQASELMQDEQRIIETSQPLLDKEEKFVDKNGYVRWLLTSKIPWIDDAGEIQGVIGIGQEITWRKQEQDILNEINRRLFEAESVSAIMEQIVAGAMRLSNTTSGIIFMVADERGNYQITESYRYPVQSQHPEPRIRSGIGITLEVITTGKSLCIPDTRIDNRAHPQLLQENIHAILAVPLKQDNKVIGVFNVNDNKPHQFTANEIGQLSSLADYAVVALEKARLIQEKDEAQHRIIALHEASSAFIASDNAEAVFETMARIALRSTGAEWVSVVLIDEQLGVSRLINYPEDKRFTVDKIRPRPDGNSLSIFDTGETQIFTDLEANPNNVNPVTLQQGFKSVIGLPLTVENNRRIGVLWLHYRQQQRFSPTQVKSLELFARQGAITYNNALRSNKIKRMGEITREVTKAILQGDKEKTLNLIVKDLQSVTHCATLSLFIYNSKRDELEHPPTLFGVNFPDLASRYGSVLRDSIVYEMLKRDTYYIAENAQADPLFGNVDFVKRENIQSSLAIPLIALGRKVGVLFVNYRESHTFTENEIDAIQTFVDQAAVAIPIAQLLDETKAHGDAFETLSSIIGDISNPADIDDILKKIVDHTIQLTGAEGSEIYLVKNQDSQYWVTKEYSSVTHDKPYPRPRLNNPNAVSRRVIDSGEFEAIDDVLSRSDLNINPELVQRGVKSMIVVPLISKTKVIGVLHVYFTKSHRFIDSDVAIIRTLASYAAIAIHNEQERTEQIETLHKIAQTIVVENDQTPTLLGILNSIRNLMPDLVAADIWFLDKNTDQLTVQARSGVPDGISDPRMSVDLGKGITGQAALQKKYLYVPDVLLDSNYLAYAQATRSELAIPMLIEGEVIGVFNLERPQIDGFTASDIQLATAIAELAVVAVQNVNLYQKVVTNREVQITAIGQMAESIAASTKGLHETLQSILAWISVLTTEAGGQPCLIEVYTLDGQSSNLNLLECWTEDIFEALEPVPTSTPDIFVDVLKHRQVISVRDVHCDQRAQPRHTRTRSQLIIPIIQDNKLYGLLNIEHPRVDALDNFVELAKAIAHILLIAIENAYQYDEIIKARRIIGGRTALAWMNLASGTWYHDVRRDASTIRNWIQLAHEDLYQGALDNLADIFKRMDASVQKILDKKEMIPLNLGTDVSPMAILPILRYQFERIKVEKSGMGASFAPPLIDIDETVIVKITPEWLEKVLDILVNNSIDAMAECKTREIGFKVNRLKGSLIINVVDTGKGLPKEIEEALSAQVPPISDSTRKGLGIGLLLAQAIVESFGGSLKVGETGPNGTTMQIYLPIEPQIGR